MLSLRPLQKSLLAIVWEILIPGPLPRPHRMARSDGVDHIALPSLMRNVNVDQNAVYTLDVLTEFVFEKAILAMRACHRVHLDRVILSKVFKQVFAHGRPATAHQRRP